MKHYYYIIQILIIFSLISCGNEVHRKSKFTDTINTGRVAIGVDETLMPVAKELIKQFEIDYKKADLVEFYLPESKLFERLFNDTMRAILTSRPFTEEEKNLLKENKQTFYENLGALDAVAIIANPQYKDTALSWNKLDSILRGNTNNKNIKVVFDNTQSSTLRTVLDKMQIDSSKINQQSVFAFQSNQEVIEYVSKTPNTLGIIGVSWISDKDDPKVLSFLNKVKVCTVGNHPDSNDVNTYPPLQAYMLNGKYPFVREVYVLVKESHYGLGTGFSSYVIGNHGQSIIRLSGLLPKRVPLTITVSKEKK
jgi:phosphate transport system substrate-binding protein